MKRKLFVFLGFMILLLVLMLCGYITLAIYYREGFSFNTWINGVYCTGKSIEEVNLELQSKVESPNISIFDIDGNAYQLPLDEIRYASDYTQSLQEYMHNQNPYLWIENVVFSQKHQVDPTIHFEQSNLYDYWKELPFVEIEQQREQAISIQITEKGYCLVDGLSNRLNLEYSFSLLEEAIHRGESTIDMFQIGAYESTPLNEKQKETMKLWAQIEAFQTCNITYDMGDKLIAIDASVASDFIALEADGTFALDENKELILDHKRVEAFINTLSDTYNTYGKEREFHATRGDIVVVKGGTYGTELDAKAEVNYLTNAFLASKSEVHIPAYKKSGVVRGEDDIGNTYIEIDMTEQRMYYYQDGKSIVETDIVTGNTSRRMGTPEGVNFVYAKQKKRVLRGPGYASPVKLWMPVTGNIGIHDASWRSKFGGEIYKKDGSHGCINTPYEHAKEIFDSIEVGIPVVMFY